MPRTKAEYERSLAGWQEAYDLAVGEDGEVIDAFAKSGRFGGIAIWIEVDEDDETVYYSPWLDQSPSEEDWDLVQDDPDAYLNMMEGATEWATVNWGEPEKSIPDY